MKLADRFRQVGCVASAAAFSDRLLPMVTKDPAEQVWLPGAPLMVPLQSSTVIPLTLTLEVLQTLKASLTATWTLLPPSRQDLQAFVRVSPLVIVGAQLPAVGSPQSAHLSVLVGGFAPQTTFKGVPDELEEAAADMRFLSVELRTADDTNEPVYDADCPAEIGPVG